MKFFLFLGNAQDIEGSKAYANALRRASVISTEECNKIVEGLGAVAKEWQEGTFVAQESDEDIHSANERRLTELIGDVGGKLHTGRSRNDQISTDVRLYVSDYGEELKGLLKELIGVMVERAERDEGVIFPGFTHLQPAQPVRWSQFLLSHSWAFQRDLERLDQSLARCRVSPLGSGALAGCPFDIDREELSRELGFGGQVTPNSMDGVSDRDFAIDFCYWASTLTAHLSRLAEDLIVYSSPSFGFLRLSEAYSTGSSLMPQKKNPDALELIRGKASPTLGRLMSCLAAIQATPSTYNKDFQECWQPLYESLDDAHDCLQVAAGCIATLEIDEGRMAAGLSNEMLATDLADYLVAKGVPFRETHAVAGSAVKMAEGRGCSICDLPLTDLQSLHPAFEEDVANIWSFHSSVERRGVLGGTSLASVREQCAHLRQILSES